MPLIRAFHRCVMLLALTVLSGCATTGEWPAPPEPDADASFSTTFDLQSAPEGRPWWESELDAGYRAWVERLLKHNPAVQIATAEVERRQALLAASEAERGPHIDANAGSRFISSDGTSSDQHQVGIDAELSLDVSGRLSAESMARHWQWVQAKAQLQQVRLVQVSSLLQALLDYAEARQRESLLQQQVATTRKQLHLTEVRFTQGLVSSVDVLQQREQIASLRQQLPGVALEARRAMNHVSELLGQTPATRMELPDKLTNLPPGIPLGRPIELLTRRPDLLAQQAALAAADADFDAALRARLPTLALSGSTLWQLLSGNPGSIVQAALDASISLYDSGARQADIQARRAELRQAGIRYLQSWLGAVRETDDQLNRLNALDLELQQTAARLETAQKLYHATLSRYQRGTSDYLPVLTALRDLQQQQREALHLKAERQRVLVQLRTATGLPPSDITRFGTGDS